MIRAIAAIDDRLGLATDAGIPWKVPADVVHFRATTEGTDVLMGYATYAEFDRPMPGRTNYVATRRGAGLRDGFQPVADVAAFLADGHPSDLWVIGGAGLFASTLSSTDELYLTRVDGDFHCTTFFPAFAPAFRMVTDLPSPPVDGVPSIRFQTWERAVPSG